MILQPPARALFESLDTLDEIRIIFCSHDNDVYMFRHEAVHGLESMLFPGLGEKFDEGFHDFVVREKRYGVPQTQRETN
jgi:hypothetical protein